MAERLTIRLLGDVSIAIGDKPLADLPSRKAEALLIYLACVRRPVAREVLADLLWDDRPQEQALANLRSILSSLRRALGARLVVTRDSIAFNHQSDYWLDVEAFEQHLADGESRMADSRRPTTAAHSTGAPSPSTAGHLQSAIRLYRGDFLAGFYTRQSRGFEEWVTLERERFQRLAVTALQQVVQHALSIGEHAAGIDHAARLTAIDPLSEDAHRLMMLLLARVGRRHEALAQYETCRRLLADEFGIAPMPETVALAERIRSAAPGHNLPPQATEFIGRESELGTIRSDLANPACRLLTIVGPGGIGKTRLAAQAARHMADAQPGLFLHGIRWLSLTAVSDPRFLITALLDALDVSPGSGDPKAVLLDFLRERECLLVLDNFEHLLSDSLSGADLLADILAHAPLVKLFVTSRERLNLREEWLFDLAGLEVPPSPLHPSPSQGEGTGVRAEDFSAVRLFVSNARRVARDFAPAPDDVRAIVHICRRVDGMPLAVELAAAAVRQQSCVDIAAALDRNLDALTTSLRNMPERHRSLRAAFDHSWGLLSTESQTAFARLSIFPDTFGGGGAQTVAEADADRLNGLVDKSLLRRQPDGRYQIHPLLRQYGAEELSTSTEAREAAAQRHAAFYMDFLAAQGDGEGADQRAAIRLEMANVRAAWRWAADRHQGETLGRVAMTLHNFYSMQSWFQEGIDVFDFALDQLSGLPVDPQLASLMCDLLGRKARMHIHIGQIDAARSALTGALAHAPRVDDPRRRSVVLSYLAITHYYAGDYAQASDLAQHSLRLDEAGGSREGVAFAYNFLGSCAKAQGEYAQARLNFTRSVETYRAMQDGIGAAMALNNLGNLAQATGEYAEAQRCYRECSDLFKAHDHLHGAATTLGNAGRLALKQGDFEAAERLLSESLALKRQMNDRRGIAVALAGLGDVSIAAAQHGAAREQLRQALSLAQEAGDTNLTLEILVAFAALALAERRSDAAGPLLAFALRHRATAQEVRERAEQLVGQLGGLSPEAESVARRWLDEEALSSVIEQALRQEKE